MRRFMCCIGLGSRVWVLFILLGLFGVLSGGMMFWLRWMLMVCISLSSCFGCWWCSSMLIWCSVCVGCWVVLLLIGFCIVR